MLDQMDFFWEYYKTSTGYTPGLNKTFNGKPTLAVVDTQKLGGAAVGYVGSTGVEFGKATFDQWNNRLLNSPYDTTFLFAYEFGRNFYSYSGKLNSPSVKLGDQDWSRIFGATIYKPAQFAWWSRSGFTNYKWTETYIDYWEIVQYAAEYIYDSSANWDTLIASSFKPTSRGRKGSGFVLEGILELFIEQFGSGFAGKFWKAVALRGQSVSAQDVADSLYASASSASGYNLEKVFTTQFRIPLSAGVKNSVSAEFKQSLDSITVGYTKRSADASGNQLLDEWYMTQDSVIRALPDTNTTNTKTGSKAIHLDLNGVNNLSDATILNSYPVLSQTVPRIIKISGWIKGSNLAKRDGFTNTPAMLELGLFSGELGNFNVFLPYRGIKDAKSSDWSFDWVYFERYGCRLTFDSTSDHAAPHFDVRSALKTGDIWISDLRVEEISTPNITQTPQIIKDVEDKTVSVGDTVTLSFGVSCLGTSGGAKFTNTGYRWYKNGQALSDRYDASYIIPVFSASDVGSYYCVANNNGKETIQSRTATITVSSSAVTAPAITTQPNSASVTAGNSASFSIVASGTSPLTYQWKKDGSSISGATSSTYTISSTSTSDAGSYTVVVTNSAGSATSNAATLTLVTTTTAPSIATQPTSASVTAGNSASFSVAASGTSPFTYQWKKDGISISGAASSTYTISSTSTSDAGSYTVLVTNSAGSATSSAATLTVAAAVTAPTITTQPTSASVTAGNSASFSIVASGASPLSYQWKKDGSSISGATSSTYTISSASTSDAGSYTVLVTNSAGTATSSAATLIVAAAVTAPTIKSQPVGITINQGQNATFSVGVDLGSSYTYQWKKDGSSLLGATTSTLRLVNVTASQAGSYSVVITNASGSTISSSAVLTVNVPLTITSNPVSRAAGIGDTMSSAFSVTATAASGVTLTYQWRKYGVNILGATNSTLGLTSIKAADFGTYSVTVSSPTGTITSSPAVLYRVSDPVVAPVITREPEGITIKAGSSLILSVAATGSPTPTYQWQLNGTAVSGATASTLVLTDILASQAGSYNVVVTNSAGSATSKSATVVINDGFGRQLSLSTLGYVGSGGDILIPGFFVAGNGVKRLLIRAAGPTLEQFGVSNVLADPQLVIFKGSLQWISNDNWSSDAANAASVVAAGKSVGAFALTTGSKDAALVVSLDPGAYSIQVSGVGGTTGKAIVEAYDLDPADPEKSRLANLATRALVQAGAGPLISGFVVQGAVAKAVLIRATGPALAGFGVPGTLELPKLTVFDSTSTPIAENTGWESSGISDQIIAASQSVGAFPLARGTADSVVLAVLPPGGYTAQVIGADGGSGVILIEVYELP
jgi:hypothetical protein